MQQEISFEVKVEMSNKEELYKKSIEHYIEQLEKTNDCLETLVAKLDMYEIVFDEQYPDEYVGVLEEKEEAKHILQRNALNKLTRMSEDLGFYKFDHERFYDDK